MKRPLLLFATVLSLGAAWLSAAPPGDWKQPTWNVPKEQYNVIMAVDPTAHKVSISHVGGKIKQDRDVLVGAFTEIVVNGTRTTLASLQVGMHVDYTLGGDGVTLAHIENRKEQAPPPTPVPTATPSFPNFDRPK